MMKLNVSSVVELNISSVNDSAGNCQNKNSCGATFKRISKIFPSKCQINNLGIYNVSKFVKIKTSLFIDLK